MKVQDSQLIPYLKSSPQYDLAYDTLVKLKDKGFEAVFAGGCVRDAMMERTPYDLDIATSATPEEVAAIFQNVVMVGAQFGVVVRHSQSHERESLQVEIASFRTDGLYIDGRRPETVSFASSEQDAQRRDFTCNALFYDVFDQQIWDYVDGINDIRKRTIRAVGNASHRLREDHLRSLRALRFVSQLEFKLDEELAEALSTQAHTLGQISIERKIEEVYKILRGESPKASFQLLDIYKFWTGIHPRLQSITYLWRTADQYLSLEYRWIHFLLLQCYVRSQTQELNSADLSKWFNELKVSKNDVKVALQIFEICSKLAHDSPTTPYEWYRMKPLFHHVFQLRDQVLFLANQIEQNNETDIVERFEKLFKVFQRLDQFLPLINGEDVMKLGVTAGPKLRDWLERAFMIQWTMELERENSEDGSLSAGLNCGLRPDLTSRVDTGLDSGPKPGLTSSLVSSHLVMKKKILEILSSEINS